MDSAPFSSNFATWNTSIPMDIDTMSVDEILERKELNCDANITDNIDKNSTNTLKRDLLEFVNSDWDEINDRIKKSTKLPDAKKVDYSEEKKQFLELKEKIKTSVFEYQIIELKLKSLFTKNEILESKIRTFYDFLEEFQQDNKDKNCKTIKSSLNDFVDMYNDRDTLKMLISQFVDKRHDLKELMSITNLAQSVCPTPTCSLCMTNPLDSFLDPCGHTGCKECLVKSIQFSNVNLNCVYCRKEIRSIRPLFIL
jgi:hypothetical protein